MKKIIKLSLAAALAATAMNAAVVDNVKMSGNAKLFYETNNANNTDMFDQDNTGTKGQILINVNASANVGPLKVNVGHSTLTSAGLEQVVVNDVQNHTETATGTATINYVGIANVSATVGGTTLIAGKQALSTPMCFTEKWNVASNTFDANVLVNTSLIPNTTLIYADVNTTNAAGSTVYDDGTALNANGRFERIIDTSMIAASTNIAGLPLNVYFYDVNSGGATAATVTWVDTTFNVSGIKIGLIAAEREDTTNAISTTTTSNTAHKDGETGKAYAISAATKIAGLNVFAAYSSVSDEDTGGFTNVATRKKTALPTQAVYVDGQNVAAAGADTWKVKVSGMKVAGINLAIQHVNCDSSKTTTKTAKETDIIASTKVAGVALKALLMQNDENGSQHEKFRVIANYSF
jgi:hypothetical protein